MTIILALVCVSLVVALLLAGSAIKGERKERDIAYKRLAQATADLADCELQIEQKREQIAARDAKHDPYVNR